MSHYPPTLPLADWQPTRDTLHRYARILGKVRGRYMPASKHWWHITLSVCARGLTTTPFPVGTQTIELTLDLVAHRLAIDSSAGWSAALPLVGQSEVGVREWIDASLESAGIQQESDVLAAFESDEVQPYDTEATGRYRMALAWMDASLKAFKGGLREETSPVHVFPHHLDLAVNWFSGRLVPGKDPADAESSDEQMNFGFVTGDGSIDDAYIYATAYPAPEGWADLALAAPAFWHTEGWTGAILPYDALANADDPDAVLLAFLEAVQTHGSALMR